MSKAEFERASVFKLISGRVVLDVTLRIDGRAVRIEDMPVSNEMMKELVATFKRHLPKAEDL